MDKKTDRPYNPLMAQYLTSANGIAEAIRGRRGTLYCSRQSRRIGELIDLAKQHGVPCRKVSDKELDRLIPGGSRGYALEIHGSPAAGPVSSLEELWLRAGNFSLVAVLDGITDPGNLGALIRSADKFACDAVIVPRRRSAGRDADSLSRSSAGAIEWVPLLETANISRVLKDFKAKGYWVWGADMNGEPAHQTNLSGKTVLVLGREGEGLHRLVRECCDGLIRIPAAGHVDSLNAAAAAGILMYEARRQQGFPYGKL
ncbi:MAG: 23S rRNA (guanosine(2251)-2'-O)-methyltransferase RlmB [Spirochaeta sp. LUC14_002_19_P3]|nr:MAG: 23S rRNA (guanosine(2251)-2'-O)-methyltransferase RlmB [Spirochaeta sp. LUC14_002_19_P3]